MSTETIFGKIIAGEIPCKKVYEDDFCLAFYDIEPVASVHILLIPKKTIVSLKYAEPGDEEVLGALMRKAGDLGRELCPGGFRVVVNSGRDAGQTVDHLHLHLLGGKKMGWPPF